MEQKVYPSMEAFLSEHKALCKNIPEQHNEPLMNSKEISEFMGLMRKHGLEEDAKAMDDLLVSLDAMEGNVSAMRQEIESLQNEVESLNGGTTLTDQFKQEITSRSITMWSRVDDISRWLMETKASILDAVREGIQSFVDKGRSALHLTCAKIYTIAIDHYQNTLECNQQLREYSQDILDRVDQLNDTTQAMRHQRGNLTRVLFGRDPQAGLDPKDDAILSSVRKLAEMDFANASKRIERNQTMLSNLISARGRHLEIVNQLETDERKPSMEDMLSSARQRAAQQKTTGKIREFPHVDRGLT